jgi:hypothetical protein
MATRSTIALELKDGRVRKIYCHWDGYLDHNGTILHNDYGNYDKIDQLTSMGDLSSLDSEIGEKHPFSECPPGQCNFYTRDRGEFESLPDIFHSVEHYENMLAREEYDYIFKQNHWYVRHHDTRGKWVLLEDELAAIED